MIVSYTRQELGAVPRQILPYCPPRTRRLARRCAEEMVRQAETGELSGIWDSIKNATNKVLDPIKKAGTKLKDATVKLGNSASRLLKKSAKSLCKVAQNPAVQQANQAAGSTGHPTAQGISQSVAAIGSFCEAAYADGEISAEEEAQAQELLQQMMAQQQTNWTPWLIAGGAGVLALLGGAFILTR